MFFFLSQCRLFILKLQMPSQGYSKLQAMLNLSSLCKKKERKNLSVKKSAIATFCDISKWGWTAAVLLQDYRWSVKAARCFVCSSVSLRNSICSLASSQSAALCTHTHTHALFVLYALSSPAVYLHFPWHCSPQLGGVTVIPGHRRFLSSRVWPVSRLDLL